MTVYLDNDFIPESEAKISVFDRGFLLGDGVYATLQVRDGHTLFLKTHLERLQSQCRNFGIEPPKIEPRLIEELIEKNEAHRGIYKLKIVITGGYDPEMALPKRKFGHLFIFLKPFTPAPYAPLKMALYPAPIMSAHASFKSLAHLNRYIVMEYAKAHGFDDGVTTTEEGLLLEASFANLCWVVGTDFYTPDKALPLHFGVTISELQSMVKTLGFTPHFARTQIDKIPEKATVFRVNTMSGIRPIVSLGPRIFKRDESLEKSLLEVYQERTTNLEGLAL